MRNIPLIALLLIFANVFLFAQGGDNGQDAERERVYQENNRRSREPEQRQKVKSNLPPRNTEPSKLDLEKLSPSQADVEKNDEFLKQKSTHITRIFPYLDCNQKLININDLRCMEAPQIIGNGSFYSFGNRSHSIKSVPDILYNGVTISGGPRNITFLTDLGDIPIEDLVNSDTVKLLKDIEIKKQIKHFAEQQKKFSSGIKIGNRVYQRKLDANLDRTYLIRLVKYIPIQKRFEEITVAFRFIRKDVNESLVLLWKEL